MAKGPGPRHPGPMEAGGVDPDGVKAGGVKVGPGAQGPMKKPMDKTTFGSNTIIKQMKTHDCKKNQ